MDSKRELSFVNQRIDELIEEFFGGSFMHNGYAKQRTGNRVCWQGTFDELDALDRGAFTLLLVSFKIS